MTRQMVGVIGCGVILAGALLFLPRRRRKTRQRKNPWVTLSRGRRAFLDEDGRVMAGVPASARGLHVTDLSAYWRDRREVDAIDCEAGPSRMTYATKREAFNALLDANPDLDDFLERTSRDVDPPGVDTVRDYYERESIDTWKKAILAAIPGVRRGRRPRWSDIDLQILQDALSGSVDWPHGTKLQPPIEAAQAMLGAETAAHCEAGRAEALEDVGTKYSQRAALEPAPF